MCNYVSPQAVMLYRFQISNNKNPWPTSSERLKLCPWGIWVHCQIPPLGLSLSHCGKFYLLEDCPGSSTSNCFVLFGYSSNRINLGFFYWFCQVTRYWFLMISLDLLVYLEGILYALIMTPQKWVAPCLPPRGVLLGVKFLLRLLRCNPCMHRVMRTYAFMMSGHSWNAGADLIYNWTWLPPCSKF
jgi:hypothetical protein